MRRLPSCWRAVMIITALVVIGCTPGGIETPPPTAEDLAATPMSTATLPVPDVATPPATVAGIGDGLATPEPRRLMALALDQIAVGGFSAMRQMGESGNPSFIPVIVDLLYFAPLLNAEVNLVMEHALARLVRQLPGSPEPPPYVWNEWVEWVSQRPGLSAPEGYAQWKGNFFAVLFDPDQGPFLYEGVKTRIRLEEVVSGGVPKDGIPDLVNPPVLTAEQAHYLAPSDRVFGVSINGEHRAYPLRIMNPHEMANDVLGGMPIALAY